MRVTSLAVAVLIVPFLVASAVRAAHPAVERAERAVEAGTVVPARDLQPLLDALARSRDVDERRELVSAIEDLGASDAETPNAVKSYLVEHAPPVLLEVARTGKNNFLQGDAVFALRAMAVPRAVLEQAAAIAEADPDSYVQSRGEILRGYIASLPAEDPVAARRAADPQKEAAAIAYLDKRSIAVTPQALRDAARRADVESVRALLAAGIAPDTGATELGNTPLGMVLTAGCTSQGEETDWLVETVEVLLTAGADAKRLDDNRNTALIHAAHWCGPRTATVLAPRSDLNHRNGSGVSAFGLAIIMGKLDTAEALLAKGARVGAEERKMLQHSATTPKAKELVAKASRK